MRIAYEEAERTRINARAMRVIHAEDKKRRLDRRQDTKIVRVGGR